MTKTTPQCSTCRVKNLSMLKNCSKATLEEFSAKKTSHFFKPGECLLKEGVEAKGVYCIRSGVAKVEVHTRTGRALILRLEGKGAIVGHRVSGEKNKQPLTITAVEEVQVCQLNPDAFHILSLKCQGLQSEMMKSLLTEIHDVEMRALSLVNHSVRERVAAALLHIAEVYHYREGGCSLHVRLDRQDIADLAGTTKEQVSKILAELRLARLISFKAKHLKYFDLAGLRKIAEEN